MNYQETIDYLYSRLPVFQNIGARAFKPGLHTTRELCKFFGDPQDTYPTIHVAGTNGKGSTSHMLAAILQEAGYRVGLYTSPHLKDFRERIRINGEMISEEFIVNFTSDNLSNIDRLNPSFFEVTVVMAFSYFQERNVDVAVIETGMGGRLDSTNVINPILSLITNISMDHTQFLGDSLAKIAFEKAGIIKDQTPVVVSEHQDSEINDVLCSVANQKNTRLQYGSDSFEVESLGLRDGKIAVRVKDKESGEDIFSDLRLDLTGSYQMKNLAGVMTAVKVLKALNWNINEESVSGALGNVVQLTGLKGRWQQIGSHPDIYCDTAHNKAGLSETISYFQSVSHGRQSFVIGFVADKDISGILQLFPTTASYYFCQPSNMRALKASELRAMALEYGLIGECFDNVNDALKEAIRDSSEKDAIYVGGSTFVVADLDQL
ncbi:bifunctional folylpolyglutamate synthase/dihydrofolate synthase [Dyadobacter bucti]|uniref:bifunctional folylpolyglutamate synthase/dihydrofolate synthase n=1 Tax=Dyadobacter bucti TaxID=2572203 RepID=UPI003F70EC71